RCTATSPSRAESGHRLGTAYSRAVRLRGVTAVALSLIVTCLAAAPSSGSATMVVVPDLAIATTNYRFVGQQVVDRTGAKERMNQEVPPGGTRSFVVEIANRGNIRETFRLRGEDSQGEFTVAYADRGKDVTAEVVKGTYEISVHGGGQRYLALQVSAAPDAPTGTAAVFTIRGENTSDTN